MRCTYSVYIESFHCFYIILHLFLSHGAASYLTMIMPVNTMKNHTLTIYQQLTPTANSNLFKAHFSTSYIDCVLSIVKGQNKVVEIWSLSTPFVGIINLHLNSVNSQNRIAYLTLCHHL